MDFVLAEKERTQLLSQLAGGQITRETYVAAVSALRVTDAAGNWWQPDPTGPGWLAWDGTAWGPGVPPSGTTGLQPGTPKTFVEFQSRLMTVDEFKKMSKEVPPAEMVGPPLHSRRDYLRDPLASLFGDPRGV
jgi:hypothetical protein